ncbi:hypothetical protein EKL97_07045 [Flavobacterium sp. LS1P28]|uniref:Uncharacterized protein n=1 Tax=Flavobacterium bomense TaxID=2497483 RepID=A0A432CQ48_9FLAO|nr:MULTISPECIES: hypothetical protein [Flavobacterium]RTY65011.1 hypothetical protein EKL95_13405 [Flavobacterium sp. LB2P53]RTY82088.1 hypothetical protein EKL97_07045 [Flavobacterium sp. LS1P28]RTY84654.1 hypothetical protein EKL99_01270 [Flavobacterium sp. ZB4P23]RTY91972.1 hypothetical protein EKM01_04950 [Flavobacterium sp. RSP46]RTZ05077.1 hypothetical protein EKM03_10085 [Flavobacterium sp. GSP6]
MTKSSQEQMLQKGVYTGIMEKDENNNFFCGAYLLDYKMAQKHSIGDWITIKSIIENPSDISYNKYPKKSKNFDKANNKPQQ